MTFSNIINSLAAPVISYAQANPLIALAAAVFLVFLIYRKPLFFFIVFLIGLLIVGALYFIMSASGSGVSVKERMIQQDGVPQNVSQRSGLRL